MQENIKTYRNEITFGSLDYKLPTFEIYIAFYVFISEWYFIMRLNMSTIFL